MELRLNRPTGSFPEFANQVVLHVEIHNGLDACGPGRKVNEQTVNAVSHPLATRRESSRPYLLSVGLCCPNTSAICVRIHRYASESAWRAW